MTRAFLLLITTLYFSFTVHADFPRCSVECPAIVNPKLGYVPGRRYIYRQKGESSLRFEKVQGGQTDMQWSSTVELSVLTPCDVAITIKEFHMDGKDSSSVPELAEVSERPLIMAISDGKVQHVCVDPEDNTWAVNAKMSVASYLQNTLPSFSEINSESIITERDIQGKCSTKYILTSTSKRNVHVVKEKDNKRCEDRFYQPSETRNNLPWLNMPLPLQKSNSICHQVIENGIYTSIECTDVNIIKPMYGVYKHITARQKAILQFESVFEVDSTLLNFSSNHAVKKDLKFDYTTPKKTDTVVPKLEVLLKQISVNVEDSVESEVASLVHQVVILLRHAPDSQFRVILEKIRNGTYGQNKEKLEHIYLAAVTFLPESGAVSIMVQEILEGNISEVRTALYAIAMHLLPRPNTYAIESLVPLFEIPQPPKTVLLAAASIINTYIRQNPWYREEKHVQEIARLVTSKLDDLRNSATSEGRDHTKLLLKALSNVGYLSDKAVSMVESLMLDKNEDTSIRVIAAQTLRHIPCKLLDHRQLLRPYRDAEENTEVRIASYLSAIRCVTNMSELNQIVQVVINETNIQVRSLVITHLTNLQETGSPHKEHLRYLLSTAVLPNDYVVDIRKFSRNTELSYFLRTLSMGAEIDSNLVYSSEETLPRSVDMNVTLDLLGNMLNVVEVGARLEGFNSFVEGVFGPEGYLMSTSLKQVLKDIKSFGRKGRSYIRDVMDQIFRNKTRGGDSTSEIKRFLESKVYSRQDEKTSPEVDLYLRLFGQEVLFASQTSDVLQSLQQIASITSLPYDLPRFIFDFLPGYLIDSDLDIVRALPINLEYIIPTMQGIPLDLYLGCVAVLGLKTSSKFHFSQDFKGAISVVPSLSLEVDGFVGFRSVARHGIKVENKLHISNGARVQVDFIHMDNSVKIQWIPLPQKLDLISFKSQTSLVKEWSPVMHKHPEKVNLRQPQGDVRALKLDKCLDQLEQGLGYHICFKANFPDLIRSSSMPFGQPIEASITAEKTGASDKGFSLMLSRPRKLNYKVISLVLETPGQAVGNGLYREQDNSYIISGSAAFSHMNYSSETRLVYDSNKFNLTVFSSPNVGATSMSPVLQFLWLREGSKAVIKARTENHLRKLIEVDADAAFKVTFSGYFFSPKIVKIYSWDVIGKVSDWEMYQKINTTSDVTDFKMLLTKAGVTHVNFTAKETPTDFRIEGYTAATLGKTGLKSVSTLNLVDKRMNVTWNLLNIVSTEKVIQASALVIGDETGKTSCEFQLQLNIPSVMHKVGIEGRIEEMGNSKYRVEGRTKYNNQVGYEVKGPIILEATGNRNVKLEITGSSQEPYKVIGQLEDSIGKKKISFVVQNPNSDVFKAVIEREKTSDEEGHILTVLRVHSLIDSKAEFRLSRDGVDIYIHKIIFPQGEYERTIKGSFSYNPTQKMVTSTFLWKISSDDPLEIRLETKYALEQGAPYTLHGDLVWNSKTLGYDTRIDISLLPEFEGHNEVNLNFRTAAGKSFEFSTILDKGIFPDKHSVNSSIHLKTTYDNDYKLTGKYVLKRLEDPRSYKLQSSISLKSPETQATFVVTDIRTGHERNVEITMGIPRSEVRAYVFGVVTTNSFQTKVDVVYASDQKILIESRGHMAPAGEGLIKSGELNAEVKLPFPVSKVLQVKSGKHEDGTMHVHVSVDAGHLNIKVCKSGPHTLNVEVETPSRTVEVEIALDSSHPSFQLWPNKGKSEDNIGISGQLSQTKQKNKVVTTFNGKFKFLQLRKEIMVSAEYSNSASELTGSLEMKGPESSKGLILLTLQGNTDQGLHANVSLLLKESELNQPMHAEIVWANSSKAIVLHSQGKEVVAFEYQRTIPEEASLWAKVKTATMDTEVSSILRDEKTSLCHGLRIHAIYKLHSQKYQTICRLCRPAYVQLVTFKKSQENDQRKYMSAGMKSPYEIELDLYVEKPGKTFLQRYADVLTMKAVVMTPRIIDLVTYYDFKRAEQSKHELGIVLTELYELWQSIVQELQEHEIYHSLKSLGADKIYQSIIKELQDFSKDLYKDDLIPSSDDIYDFIDMISAEYVDVVLMSSGTYKPKITENLKGMRKVLLQVMELYDLVQVTPQEVVQVLTDILPWEKVKGMIRELKEEYYEAYQRITYAWETLNEEVRQLMPSENMTEEAGSCSRDCQDRYESIIETMDAVAAQTFPEPILRYFEDRNPELYTTLRHVLFNILADIKQDAQHIVRSSPFRQVTDWFLHSYKFDDIPQTDDLIDFLYWLLVQTPQMMYDSTGRGLQLRVPFIYPEYSLHAVPYGTLVSNGLDLLRRIIGIHHRILPVDHSPLHKVMYSSAVYYGDGYVSTFDGTTIKLPDSHCPYILTTDGYDYVAVTHLPGNKREFNLTVENGRHMIAIDKDYQVYINGTKKTEEKMDHSSHGYAVYQSPTQVIVIGKSLKLSVPKYAPDFRLYATTELQGRLLGVMGTFNDFQGDDMMMPYGNITHDPTTFLKSWQVNPSC